jgi:hypothetical protein
MDRKFRKRSRTAGVARSRTSSIAFDPPTTEAQHSDQRSSQKRGITGIHSAKVESSGDEDVTQRDRSVRELAREDPDLVLGGLGNAMKGVGLFDRNFDYESPESSRNIVQDSLSSVLERSDAKFYFESTRGSRPAADSEEQDRTASDGGQEGVEATPAGG